MAPTAHRLVSLLGIFTILAAVLGLSTTATVASALTVAVLATLFGHARAAIFQTAALRAATRAATVRELTRHTAFLPQRDPDAAGRTRPRAPGQVRGAVGMG